MSENLEEPEQKAVDLPPSLATSLALLVATLVAIGVSGDFIPRLVRDEPGKFVFVVLMTLGGAVLIAAVSVSR